MDGEPQCVVAGSTVTCEGSDIAGVGNLDAVATLTVVYSATVECTNPGGQVVEAQETTFDDTVSSDRIRPKNGRLTVPVLSSEAPTLTPAEENTFCPNPRWDANLTDVQLESFEYSIVFIDRKGNVVDEFYSISG